MKKEVRHILVVDDDTRIRDLLAQFLIENGYFVSTAKDGAEARNYLKEFVFDIIIMDIMMPGETGIEITQDIRHKIPTPVLMLTAMNDVEDRIKGLESGADDYLQKPFEPRELLLRVQKILERTKVPNENSIIRFGNFEFDLTKKELFLDNNLIALTSNESGLLTILCNNLNKILTREQLAKEFGGVNERTIDVQITRLRNKIESDPKKSIHLKTIRNKGYILHP